MGGNTGAAKIWKNENILQAVSLIGTLAVPLRAVGNIVCVVLVERDDHLATRVKSPYSPPVARVTRETNSLGWWGYNVIKSISGGRSQDKQILRGEGGGEDRLTDTLHGTLSAAAGIELHFTKVLS